MRYGGDEFAVLFSDTHEQGAWIALEYLVEQTQAWNLSSGKPWKLAFSWGVSEFDHNGNGDIKAWLEDADAKMYAMKTKNHRER